MDYTHLGRSGVSVSRICLGTMNFGSFTDADDAHQIMDHALEQGINFFDTANTYGRPRAEGVTERIIGSWLCGGGPGRRDKVVLATKVYGGQGEWPNDRFLSAVNIRRSCEESLSRLGTDRIDLYQQHLPDQKTPIAETIGALSELVAEGKIREFGCSNFTPSMLQEAEAATPAGEPDAAAGAASLDGKAKSGLVTGGL